MKGQVALKAIENDPQTADAGTGSGKPKYRRVRDRRQGVPAVEFEFTVRFHCELLEGNPADLDRIAEEFASYLQRRDDQIGLIAARDWALLVDEAHVQNPADPDAPATVIDVRRAPRQ